MPKGDLYHWIPLLDRFDGVLEQFVKQYGLNEGPETEPISRALLQSADQKETNGSAKEESETTPASLNDLGYQADGDRELVESILGFSTLLLENCGNRSLYNSSERIGHLLNTTSLSLLAKSLRLAVRLAQRYAASRQRGTNASQHINHALLASHFNIDLENMQKLAGPFTTTSSIDMQVGLGGAKSSASQEHGARLGSIVQCNDLHGMSEDGLVPKKGKEDGTNDWTQWGSISYNYYPTAGLPNGLPNDDTTSNPSTPTPVHRTSTVSRPSRLSHSEDASSTASTLATNSKAEDAPTDGSPKIIEIPRSLLVSRPLIETLKSCLPKIPSPSRYDFLNRVRTAHAITTSIHTRRQIVAVRILAVTCLAHIYPEEQFQEKLLQQDSNQPRRLQLPYQLADLIHPPGNGNAGIPIELRTYALGCLDALTKHKSKAADVCSALNVNVNHGVLLYVLCKAAAELAVEGDNSDGTDADDWREALVALLEALPTVGTRTGDALVSAGLFEILIDILNLRTDRAERYHSKILIFLNNHIYGIRDAFQTFANLKGFDVIANLVSYEVTSCLKFVEQGGKFPTEWRNQVIDYQVPFFQQQTLRWAFKYVNHMMAHGNTNFDRLLRNLVDSPQLLRGLLGVISNASAFGSNVWSGAVSILSSFIHNEPTCYAIIAEAGLIQGFLDAISEGPNGPVNIAVPEITIETENSALTVPVPEHANGHLDGPGRPALTRSRSAMSTLTTTRTLSQCILPATDAIMSIPHAFGAICLNNAGLELFLSSDALSTFFGVFVSSDHLKALAAEMEYPKLLGRSFDELVRHHPRLKTAVMDGMLTMLSHLTAACKELPQDEAYEVRIRPPAIYSGSFERSPNPPSVDTPDVEMGDSIIPLGRQNSARVKDEKASVVIHIHVMTRFVAGFVENSSLAAKFVESGAISHLVDIATLPSLPFNFGTRQACHELSEVFQKLITQKPHLVVPAVLGRLEENLVMLKPLLEHSNLDKSYFARHVISDYASDASSSEAGSEKFTTMRALVNVYTLSEVLAETFEMTSFTQRASPTVFTQLNLTDQYVPTIEVLGQVHRSCLWERTIFESQFPMPTLPSSLGLSTNNLFGDDEEEISRNSLGNATVSIESIREELQTRGRNAERRPSDGPESKLKQDQRYKDSPYFESISHLLNRVPSAIIQLFQSFGRSIVSKRRSDPYIRQSGQLIADALAGNMYLSVKNAISDHSLEEKDKLSYWVKIVSSLSTLVLESYVERPHQPCLTLVLQSFARAGGLNEMKSILQTSIQLAKRMNEGAHLNSDETASLTTAHQVIQRILLFFAQITSAKCIVEAAQSQSLNTDERDRENPLPFSGSHLLVRIRAALLPTVHEIWESDVVEILPQAIMTPMIEILRTTLDSEQEGGSNDKNFPQPTGWFKTFNISADKMLALRTKGYDDVLAREALYRCNNNRDFAEEYCKIHQQFPKRLPRLPIPVYDHNDQQKRPPRETSSTPSQSSPHPTTSGTDQTGPVDEVVFSGRALTPDAAHDGGSTGSATPSETESSQEVAMPEAPSTPLVAPQTSGLLGDQDDIADESSSEMALSIDNLSAVVRLNNPDFAPTEPETNRSVSTVQPPTPGILSSDDGTFQKPTVEDLGKERAKVRATLIDRVLNVLHVQDFALTFELAELLIVGTAKAHDATSMRQEIGTTLVQSLMSQMGDDVRTNGDKIAASAKLLALVIQEKEFYEATLDELKDETNLNALFGYIKITPDQTSDKPSPWIGQILLIIEKLLAEDVQPQQIRWIAPVSLDDFMGEPIVEVEQPLISIENKMKLFDVVMETALKTGKDESLGLSIMRVLVILSRNREIASQLAEKRLLQGLFVMVKQLRFFEEDKLRSAFMQVLRHIIEDDNTLRQIMESEIVANFEARTSRPMDTTTYTRSMFHLILRSPKIFVEVTNEIVKVNVWNPNERPQVLVLKKAPTDEITMAEPTAVARSNGSLKIDDDPDALKSNKAESDKSAVEVPKPVELKPPVVEHPDGVIHLILCQLLSYKDVEDSPTYRAPSNAGERALPAPTSSAAVPAVEVPSTPVDANDTSAFLEAPNRENNWAGCEPKDYPVALYRWFLLQCLAELLGAYDRCKIEFINFSRKAAPTATTSSKPRSGVLNYLLNGLIPVGSLVVDDIPLKIRSNTSRWAASLIYALCSRTCEKGYNTSAFNNEKEPELFFVRKFVLEHALKAFKDAQSSVEPLDAKYARLLSLAELFSDMLSGRPLYPPTSSVSPQGQTVMHASHKELARIMYEKGFVNAFTSAIADIDLNFPNSKYVIKYILKPLKVLTTTAIRLSQEVDDLTTLGDADEDAISSASSLSEVEDEREETPDLFRHSTLGMLEPGRESGSSSETSDEDEEMYDEGYEGMEFEEEMERDGDEVISDEDEEIDGVGPMEGLPDDVDVNVQVVIDDGDGDEDDDDSDEDDPEDSEDMDDADGIEGMEEINGDDENASLADGENEWQDAGDDVDRYDGEGMQHDGDPPRPRSAIGEILDGFSAMGSATRFGPIDDEAYMEDNADNNGDEDEDGDGDEEVIEGEEVVWGREFEGEDVPNVTGIHWQWGGDEEAQQGRGDSPAFLAPGIPVHHGRRAISNPWPLFPIDRAPIGQSHHPSVALHVMVQLTNPQGSRVAHRSHGGHHSHTAHDGTNPLLQREVPSNPPAPVSRRDQGVYAPRGLPDWIDNMNRLEALGPRGLPTALSNLLNNIASGQGVTAVGGPNGFSLQIAGHRELHMPIPRELQQMLGIRNPPSNSMPRPSREDTQYATVNEPTTTITRWEEEARLLYGTAFNEKAQRVVNSLLKSLVPPAMAEERTRKEKAWAETRKAKEAAERLAEDERLAREAAVQAEKEKKEVEEREAAERAAQQPVEETPPTVEETPQTSEAGQTDENAMEGIEPTGGAGPTPSQPATITSTGENGEADGTSGANRVHATFRGREIDITGLGIDLEYLNALPEELREEVLMQQLAEQRSQAAAAGEAPTEFDQDFLAALPPEIREELLQQEAQDRRRREREENRRRAAASGAGPAGPADGMDTADFIASLDPNLRQAILMEQDEEVLAHLPETIAAEARALGSRTVRQNWGERRPRAMAREMPIPVVSTKRPPRKQVIQMLDKAGVATLLRLLFIPQQGSSRTTLHEILDNVILNRQNRAEVISLLLSILQDGSADLNAVERGFQALSLRAKQTSAQKTPQSAKRTLSGPLVTSHPEMTPLMVIQQCLSALVHLTDTNMHVPSFFWVEHENWSAMKSKSSKKGKNKETRASKFPLNALLGLLDRELIMESSTCMEQLSTLLQYITTPLNYLVRREKERASEILPALERPTQGQGLATPQAHEPPAVETNPTEVQEDVSMPDTTSPIIPETEVPAEQGTTNATDAENPATATSEKKEKEKSLVLPEIPEYNLRLIIRILAARECTSKTFRDTLSTINNLLVLPEAKEIFSNELVKQAQDLGGSILKDLDELVPQIRDAESSADIQGMALAKFSPSSSDQAKLLRILTALDYLFDPKREKKAETGDASSKTPEITAKDDMLTSLYENSTFGSLWTKLSECLSAIRQRQNMLNIPTILLPLVEALMVVCKNTTLKELPLSKAIKDFAVTSPPPESRMENLFFRFTEDHRKILNDLVRQNPRLMSGTFSLLVKNPKVLEFDNKRNYFTRKLHTRSNETRHTQPPLQLQVRRDQVFLDSFKSLYFKSGDEMKFGKFNIRFHGEEGIDAGGVTREWFQVMSRQMFDPNYALFVPVASDRTTFHPNKLSHVNPEHLMFFKFIGRVIGKALYEGRALDCHFSRAVYKRLLGKAVSIKDMETLDLDYYKSLMWLLENDVQDIITETFSVETDAFGEKEIVDLREDGRNIQVTDENKHEYVQLVVEHRLTGSVKAQLEEFLRGMSSILLLLASKSD